MAAGYVALKGVNGAPARSGEYARVVWGSNKGEAHGGSQQRL